MTILYLLIGFFRVGLFSFGGAYGAIPLIRDVAAQYGFMTDEELTYMIAVSESTPGPIVVNMATFVGSKQAGVLGAAVATFAVVLPAFLIILLLVTALKNVMNNRYVAAAIDGLTPAVIGIIFATGAFMIFENMFPAGIFNAVDLRDVFLTVFLLALMFGSKKVFGKKISPILFIVVAAAMGMVVYI